MEKLQSAECYESKIHGTFTVHVKISKDDDKPKNLAYPERNLHHNARSISAPPLHNTQWSFVSTFGRFSLGEFRFKLSSRTRESLDWNLGRDSKEHWRWLPRQTVPTSFFTRFPWISTSCGIAIVLCLDCKSIPHLLAIFQLFINGSRFVLQILCHKPLRKSRITLVEKVHESLKN